MERAESKIDHDDMLNRLAARPGILGYLLGTDAEFRRRFGRFLAGSPRVFWIAGEPANGKSTLIGDIVLALRDLGIPLAGVAFDPVHALLFEQMHQPLPVGETPVALRRIVCDLLRDTLLHVLEQLPADTRVLVEAPLIGVRGEGALAELLARGHAVQAIVLHNPHVWQRVYDAGGRPDAFSAQVEAMGSIRRGLLERIGAADLPPGEQQERLAAHWRDWADRGDRMVLTWHGPESDAAALETDARLRLQPVSGKGLFPETLVRYARDRAAALLAEAWQRGLVCPTSSG
jgi:hypothetical protein